MSPIAAYFVMTAADAEHERRTIAYAVPARKTSRLERIATALETLIRLGRPSLTQPA